MVSTTRLGAFTAVFLIMACLEMVFPRRKLTQKKATRWFINLSITAIYVIVTQVFFGAIAVSTAFFAQKNGWGLCHFLHLSPSVSILLSLLILDFGIYIQHILFHAVPLFWRFHKVHHTDLDFDVTTGLRFHPFEIIISLFYKMALIVVIGAPPIAVIVFEIILNASSQFTHGNIHIPSWLDKILRWVLVTPDIHRIHHSIVVRETNSNFGFCVTWWDRLCGTFRNHPKSSQTEMKIGLENYQNQKELNLWTLLKMPLFQKSQKGDIIYSFESQPL